MSEAQPVEKKRILFVDDEPAVLEGLRNVLRTERKRWEMRFANGGAEALELLGREASDVVITDMRMPAMDGVALLREVQSRWPEAARVVLSGHADIEAVARASAYTHQYLLKPCDAAMLRAVIARACELQDLFRSPELRRAVGSMGALPTAPRIYTALTQALRDDDFQVKKLAAIVEVDPGVTARLLQFVNSAWCGLAREVTSIEQAIVYVGVQTLRHLALTLEVPLVFGLPPGAPLSLEELEMHAGLTARLARRLVPGKADADVAFTAGLLHDAGQLALASRLPGPFTEACTRARDSGRPLDETEREVMGVCHGQVGGYLLGLWGLPHSVVEAVTFHHDTTRMDPAVGAVHAAVCCADLLASAALAGRPLDAEQVAHVERTTHGRIIDWQSVALSELEQLRKGLGT